MAKTKISEYDSSANNNTDVASVNIDEGCAPSGINNAIRAVMAHLKDFQQGTNGDSFNGPVNGTIGATTPAAGTFTTLSTTGNTTLGNDSGDVITINGSTAFGAGAGITGNLTLSSGTANGVAYLNGSKVLTTGSALTFDGNLLVSPSASFNQNYTPASGSSVEITYLSSTGYITSFNRTSSAWTDLNIRSLNTIFNVGGSEGMRLTSTGLGIGTSSPNYVATLYKASLPVLQLANSTSGSTASDGLLIYLNGANATISNEEAGSIGFQTSGALRATLDSAGNLGLGVTPSAWGSGFKALEVGRAGSGFFSVATDSLQLTNNYYYNGTNYIYAASGYAERYHMVSGQHRWYTAPSGTAGDAISFTQAMTLDASGNLIVGGTSATGKAEVVSSGSQSSLVLRNSSSNSSTYSEILFAPFTGTTAASAYIRNLYFQNNESAITFGTTNTSSAPTERARIDSSGNLLVNCTSTGVTVDGLRLTAGNVAQFSRSNADALSVNRNGTDGACAVWYKAGTQVGSVSVTGSSTAYNTSSDYRLKEDVQPMTGALAKVAALKPCTYKWKADGSDGEGFIAHELQAVVPQCVTGEKDAVDADGKPVYQGIDTSFLVATLTAAIQEQQAIINQLKARLDAANL